MRKGNEEGKGIGSKSLHHYVQRLLETEIADEQAGFRQDRRTRDQITNLRILMHKASEHNNRSICAL